MTGQWVQDEVASLEHSQPALGRACSGGSQLKGGTVFGFAQTDQLNRDNKQKALSC